MACSYWLQNIRENYLKIQLLARSVLILFFTFLVLCVKNVTRCGSYRLTQTTAVNRICAVYIYQPIELDAFIVDNAYKSGT